MSEALSIVQRFYPGLAAGYEAAALQLLDPEIEWTEAEGTPYFIGTMRGVEAVVSGLFEPLGRDFTRFTTTPHEFVQEGDRVVAFGRYSGFAQRSGRTLSAPYVHQWTVSNGRLRRFTQ
jgi:uncharacterized protein